MGDKATQTVSSSGVSTQPRPVQQLPAGPDYWPVPLSEHSRVA